MRPHYRAILLCATVAVSWPATADGQPPNLVVNPGFEDGLSGWEVVNPVGAAATVEASRDDPRAGALCLDCGNTDEADLQSVGARQVIEVPGGGRYVLSLDVRHTALRSSGGVRVSALDADGHRLLRTWPTPLYNWESGWRRVERTVRLPAQTSRVELFLAVNGLGEAWFDDVSLTAAREPDTPEHTEPVPTGIAVTRYDTRDPVMVVRVHDLDGDGVAEVLTGDVEHRLRVRSGGGTRWTFDLSGLPCDIACGDREGDGPLEIAVATMNAAGDVMVLSTDGEPIWTRSIDDGRCSRVAWADLDGDGSQELIIGSGPHLWAHGDDWELRWELDVGGPRLVGLTAGDIDGDGRDEVLAGYSAQTLRVVALDDDGRILWRFNPDDWPGSAAISSLFVADIDADGAPEVVGAGDEEAVFALEADGTEMWRHLKSRGRRETLLAAPVTYGGETRILLLARNRLQVRSGDGALRFESDSGLTFIGAHASPQEPNAVYVASSGLRDPHCYRLEFAADGDNELPEQRVPDPVGPGLDHAFAAVSDLPLMPRPAAASRTFHVLLYRNNRQQVEAVWDTLRTRSGENVEYEILSYVKELPVELHRFPMSSHEEILEYAGFFEERGIPFWLFVCHGCRPWITVETAAEILAAAPQTCRGFYSAEDTSHYATDLFYDWLAWVGEMIELCHQHGRRVILKQMFDAWSLVASDREVYDVLFRHPETVIPMFATNNAHAPELQIGGMVGLWRAGACHDWGMSSQHWAWNWGRDCSWRLETADICPPDIILRMDLAAASLGCTYFHVEGGQRWLSRDGEVEPEATRHRELLYRMMDRNLIVPPGAERLEGLSPLVIARRTDLGELRGLQVGTPRGRIGTRLRDGLLGVGASMQTVREDYLPAHAYGLRHYFDGFFPATAFGCVPLVPEWLAPSGRVIRTDGAQVSVGDRTMAATEAMPEVLRVLEAAAAKLPLQTGDAFLSAQRWGEEHRLVLVDPGFLAPKGSLATVVLRLERPPETVVDLLTGESIPLAHGTLTVQIPPGGFRLLSVPAG